MKTKILPAGLNLTACSILFVKNLIVFYVKSSVLKVVIPVFLCDFPNHSAGISSCLGISVRTFTPFT